MKVIGIDNGVSGVLTVLDLTPDGKRVQEMFPVPIKVKKGGGNRVDFILLSRWFDRVLDQTEVKHMFLEENQKGYGQKTNSNAIISTAQSFITILNAFEWSCERLHLKIPYDTFAPSEWQGHFWKKSSGDTKVLSVETATRLFPGMDFRKSALSKKPSSDVTDSCLIGLYGSIKNGYLLI